MWPSWPKTTPFDTKVRILTMRMVNTKKSRKKCYKCQEQDNEHCKCQETTQEALRLTGVTQWAMRLAKTYAKVLHIIKLNAMSTEMGSNNAIIIMIENATTLVRFCKVAQLFPTCSIGFEIFLKLKALIRICAACEFLTARIVPSCAEEFEHFVFIHELNDAFRTLNLQRHFW